MAKVRYGVCNAMIEVENEEIESLPSDVLEQLDCGDFIIKKTGNQKHRYFVSYKEAGVGMCFTYVNSGYSETISYDYVDGAWVFNSKDVSQEKSDSQIKELAKEEVESAESGTIANALGLNNDGDLVKGTISGGTQLYKHEIPFNKTAQGTKLYVVSTSSSPLSNVGGIHDCISVYISGYLSKIVIASSFAGTPTSNKVYYFDGSQITDLAFDEDEWVDTITAL